MSCESFCWSPDSFLKNSAVPERAIVPRCEMASSRLMPMPLSRMESVLRVASASIQTASSGSPAMSSGLLSASKRNLSLASEAFEISSRRKISRWLYSEWIMSFSSSRTSALKPSVSVAAAVSDMRLAPAGKRRTGAKDRAAPA